MPNFLIEGPGGIPQIKMQGGYNSALPITTSDILTARSIATTGGELTINNATGTLTTQLLFEGQFSGNDAFVMRRNSSPGGFTDFRIIGVNDAPAILSLIGPNNNDYADYTFDGNNAEIDLSIGNLSLRPLAGNVQIYNLSSTVKLRLGSSNFTQAMDMWHDGTNGNVSTTTGVIKFLAPVNFGKVQVATGSNASAGTGTLSAGTVTISTTAVTASSLIFLTATSKSANSGSLSVGTVTAGTSFVVNSTNASDGNTFNWLIIN